MQKKLLCIIVLIIATICFILGLYYWKLYKPENDTIAQNQKTYVSEQETDTSEIEKQENTADYIINNKEITDEYAESLDFQILNMDRDIEHYINDVDDFTKQMQKEIYAAGYDINKVLCTNVVQVNYKEKFIQLYFTLENEKTTFLYATVNLEEQRYDFIFVDHE